MSRVEHFAECRLAGITPGCLWQMSRVKHFALLPKRGQGEQGVRRSMHAILAILIKLWRLGELPGKSFTQLPPKAFIGLGRLGK